MRDIEKSVRHRLFELQDQKYRDFNSKLIPTVAPETVIGVRTPELRKYARELAKTADGAEFIKIFPHKYYEENNLHGFLLEKIKDYDELIKALDNFLPYVDNWATCDLMSPPIFKKHTAELLLKIEEWIKSEHTYTVRFGIKMLMSFYLDDNFKAEYLELAAGIKSEEYYINMMIAWYFATALAKQYESAVQYLESRRLDKWVHNKTIQKAVESYRISKEQKEYLKSLRLK